MIPGPVLAAFTDRRLSRRDLLVFGVALSHLSYYAPRPLKLRVVARTARMHCSEASRALRSLVASGYLEPGPSDGPRRTYLLRATLPGAPEVEPSPK